jgi:hypothetical protein
MADCDAVVRAIVLDPTARVFAYRSGESLYVAVRNEVAGRAWLPIFDLNGGMETAFPPADADAYLAHPGFTEIGTVAEVLA